MSKELDIQIAVNSQSPNIVLNQQSNAPNVQMGLKKTAVFYISDYETLTNRPQINNVILTGNQTNNDLRIVMSDTRANWDEQQHFIPKAGQIIVYSDYYGENKPAAKIGDGQAYLIDLPIVGAGLTSEIMQVLDEHVANAEIHVTTAEKEFWNNKLNVEVSGETMTLNRY